MKYYKDFAQFLEKYEDQKNAASNQTGVLAHVKLISVGGTLFYQKSTI